jgi:serine/threonine protein kinase/formylglycine-generating enzyme required for sulfatase activity
MNGNPTQEEWLFGDYEVLRNALGELWLLGSGSYGRTYKARNRLLGTEVAIKVIRRDLSANDKVRQRFLNEGRSLANLAHEHIALLRHFGISDGGQIYYAMDYCAGGTLAERVSCLGPRPPGEALEILRQVTSALVTAHARGIIHRDLKPGNIMLSHAPPPLHVKVIDFGLAQASTASAAGVKFQGTVQWASPEQLRELPLDGRSDLFSLGLLLWFLLDGSAPDSGSPGEVLQRRLAPEGYAGRLPPHLPTDILDLLVRLLETDPNLRVGTAGSLLDDLNRLVANHPYEPHAETRDKPDVSVNDGLPRLSADASIDDRYARLTRLHRDLAGEWFEAELQGGSGNRIVFVLDESLAKVPELRAKVRDNLERLWRRPVDGLPAFLFLLESGDALVAEWQGRGGGDFASWLKLRRKPVLREMIAFLAAVAQVADETAGRGVPGVGLMASQLRLEADSSDASSGPACLAPRVFPLLLGAGDLPPAMNEQADSGGSTLALVGPELACDHIHMTARLIYRAVARHEAADAVAFSAEAYVPASGLTEAGNQLLRQTLCRLTRWDSCLALVQGLAAHESLLVSGSGSWSSRSLTGGSSMGSTETLGQSTESKEPAKAETGSTLPAETQTIPPPQAPVPPALWPVHPGKRIPAVLWLVIVGSILSVVAGIAVVKNLGRSRVPGVAQPPALTGPEAALASGKSYTNPLGMSFVEAGTKRVMFCVWETRVGDFKAFVESTNHDAIAKNEYGVPAYTVKRGDVVPVYVQDGGSWRDPHWEQSDQHPVVCVSYRDAEKFCEWLTGFDSNLPAGWEYRLPDDAEWSAACPDGFLWENGCPPRNIGNYCGREAMVGALKGYRNDLAQDALWEDDWPRTAPVGSFKSNSFGLYDMGGNVAEWCATFYQHPLNPKEIPEELLPLCEDQDAMKLRVLRGASWSVWNSIKLRADFHDCENPLVRNDYNGFRVVLADRTAGERK